MRCHSLKPKVSIEQTAGRQNFLPARLDLLAVLITATAAVLITAAAAGTPAGAAAGARRAATAATLRAAALRTALPTSELSLIISLLRASGFLAAASAIFARRISSIALTLALSLIPLIPLIPLCHVRLLRDTTSQRESIRMRKHFRVAYTPLRFDGQMK